MPQSLPEAIAQSWILPLWPTAGTLIAGFLYLRGWRVARITRPRELPPWRAWCFFAGLLSLWLALASPLDALDQFLLLAHMTQHVLLMTVTPPLLLIGNPIVPMLRGLPRSFVRDELAPWMNSRAVHWLQRLFTSPVFGWISMDAAVVAWHLPALYELALRSNFWHQVEHGCFFFFSLAFWWYVIRPWPNRYRSSRWLTVPYLISSHMVLSLVGLIIAFEGHVIYPSYAHVPRLFGLDALTDQALAGGEMLYVGLLVIIGSLVPILVQLVSEKPRPAQAAARQPKKNPVAGAAHAPAFDLLRLPVAGPALRRRHGRHVLQAFSFVVLAAVIVDGLHGVQVPQLNLAGAMLWNVARPLNLILLLLFANLFCMACPFTLPRELVRRLGFPQLRWPERLSSKWPAVMLMLIFFWAYEQFALWSSPRDTALLLVAYVATASIINSVFRGASFCKYVCPVGQFNFIASQFAPAELGVRSQHVCTSCATHDCVRGNETQHGCELKLYLPSKAGNLDCTLCMDCVKACPQDNVSITLQSPLRELGRDPVRSSLGRTSARPDLAVLVLVVVFSSLANAAVMTAPVVGFLNAFRQQHPWAAGWLLSLSAVCVFSAALLLLYTAATRLMQSLAGGQNLRTVFCRFAMALLPLGLSIWLGHLAFHLATSWSDIPVVLQHLSTQISPAQHHAAMAMTATSSSIFTPILSANGMNLFDLQIWIVNLGLFVSWYGGRKLITDMAGTTRRTWPMTAVWAVSSTALYAAAIWIFAQLMYMRGMGM
jgi:cytochrome c oxidase assembly factor CtaG/ferredoxin